MLYAHKNRALNVRGVRARCWLAWRCWLSLRPRLLLLLLELFLLFLLRHVMAYGAAGRGAQYGVVSGNVSGYGADCRALEATLRYRTLSAGE